MSVCRKIIAGVSITAALWLLALLWLPRFEKQNSPVYFNHLSGDSKKGEYVLRMAGCVACHTDIDNEGVFLAGGAAIDTGFGQFYAPNITPDKQYGIGEWTLNDLYNALTAGISPDKQHYYPVFPYTSYHLLKPQDIADLKAYLDTVPAAAIPSPAHHLKWPFSIRRLMGIWKWLYFKPVQAQEKPEHADTLPRGAYLVNGPGHCAACHSERNLLGGLNLTTPLSGNQHGPEGNPVPAIAGPEADLRQWEKEDIILYLQTGIELDGDAAGGAMSEVIYESTSYLSDEDIEAIAGYLLYLNPR